MATMMVLAILVGVGAGIGAALRAVNRVPPGPKRRIRMALAIALITLVLGGCLTIGALSIQTKRQLSRPDPSFPSLSINPDPSLHGTIAYVASSKDVARHSFSACARVASASGAITRDVACWPFDNRSPATVRWVSDAELLVTVFRTPPRSGTPVPIWAKIVNVSDGTSTPVSHTDLGKNAQPPATPRLDPAGNLLMVDGGDGNVTVSVGTQGRRRIILSVRNSNPLWNIQDGPTWSPDFRWVLTSDGHRLLLTTMGPPSSTRILSEETIAMAAEHGWQTFDISPADLLTR